MRGRWAGRRSGMGSAAPHFQPAPSVPSAPSPVRRWRMLEAQSGNTGVEVSVAHVIGSAVSCCRLPRWPLEACTVPCATSPALSSSASACRYPPEARTVPCATLPAPSASASAGRNPPAIPTSPLPPFCRSTARTRPRPCWTAPPPSTSRCCACLPRESSRSCLCRSRKASGAGGRG